MTSSRRRAAALAALCSAAALSAAATLASAQSPEASCAKLLSAEKLQVAAGKGFNLADARNESGGEFMCAWMRREGGFATLAVQYYPKGKVSTPLPELYENVLTPHETGKTKRAAIAGFGKRAAFVAADPQQLVAIERDDAVLRVVMNNFSKAQAIAVAKAVGSP